MEKKKEIDYEVIDEKPWEDNGGNGGHSETKDATDKWATWLTIGVGIAFIIVAIIMAFI